MFVTAFARTPFARVHGALSGWHPAELLAAALTGLEQDPPPQATLLVGCAQPVGAQGSNVGRAATLLAGWPTIGATTVSAGGNSSHNALHLAVAADQPGIVAGVEVMSLVPDGAADLSRNYGPAWGPAKEQFAERGGLIPFGVASDRVSEAQGYDRADLDLFAAAQRTLTQHPAPIPVTERTNDREATPTVGDEFGADQLAALPIEAPPLHEDEATSAATNLTPAADGAVALVVEPEPGPAPLARIVATAYHAGDPLRALNAPALATQQAVNAAGRTIADLVLVDYDAPSAAAARLLSEQLNTTVQTSAFARGRPTGASALATLAQVAVGLATGQLGGVVSVSTDGGAAFTLLEGCS